MYSTFFVNNKTYGADDINKVFAHLTTQGVSLYKDTGEPLIDLDTAMSNLTSEGAQVYDTNGCKVVSVGNGYYKISKGCYWLASGACIIFDDDGYVFELNFLDASGTEGTTCYVYLRQGGAESEGVSNDINIIVSGEAPADTDALLATISSAGVITDKRKVAVSKLSAYTGDPVKTISITLTAAAGTASNAMPNYGYPSSGKVQLPAELYKYGYIYNASMNGVASGNLTSYVRKLTSNWGLVCKEIGNTYDYYLYARKTDEAVELELMVNSSSLKGGSKSYNLQLFLGEAL